MRWLGVVSDTHGDIANTQKAVQLFESRQVQLVVHCGDIGSPEIPPLFARWPTHYVLGNVDGSGPCASAIEEAGQTLHGRFGTIAAGGRRIALIHSDDSELVPRRHRQPRLGPRVLRTHASGQMPRGRAHDAAQPGRRPLRLSAVGGPGGPGQPRCDHPFRCVTDRAPPSA